MADYCHYTNGSMESLFLCSLLYGGGRSPHYHNKHWACRRRGWGQFGTGSGNSSKNNPPSRGNEVRAVRLTIVQTHVTSWWNSMRRSPTSIIPLCGAQKKNSYSINRSYPRSLINGGTIPFPAASTDNFIDIVVVNHSIFELRIINTTTDDYDDIWEDLWRLPPTAGVCPPIPPNANSITTASCLCGILNDKD